MKPETAAELEEIYFYMRIRMKGCHGCLKKAMESGTTAGLPIEQLFLPGLKKSLADITRAIELLEKEN